MEPLKIAVHGACGRMGQRVVAGVHRDPELELVAALESSQHPKAGTDIGLVCGLGELGIAVSDKLPRQVDGVIDFSVPEASVHIAEQCAEREVPLVVATTGHTPEEREKIIECHHTMPLLFPPNTSLVVNLLMKLTRDAARVLRGRDFDVEIIERHHRFKVDAPSGTALRFAEIIEKEMEIPERVYGREGITGKRPRGQIGVHAVRVGDNVGEHTIIFSTLGETMELVHKGHSVESYVTGALAAIKFLVTKKAGLYSMDDVLGLNS